MAVTAILDPFIPNADHGARHETLVQAPADLVFAVARSFEMTSIPLIRLTFWAREKVMGAKIVQEPAGEGIERLLAMGWGRLAEAPGCSFIGGAACQPWLGDVVSKPIPPEQFTSYIEPDHVKIAWTLEAEPLSPVLTRLATETRVVATDEVARRKFKKYWRWARFGIVGIRLLLVPAMRREAERRWKASGGAG